MEIQAVETACELKADKLKKVFSVFGYFYDRKFDDGSTLKLRETLEIVAHEQVPLALNDLLDHDIDAIVLMMNPGSSKPTDKGYIPVTTSPNPDDIAENRELIKTVPDNAQYQIMRLMVTQGWKHVRILNLSDIRQPKSAIFIKQAKTVDPTHSIWSDGRSNGLKSLLEKTPLVIKAWGQDKGLLPLAIQAESALHTTNTIGVEKSPHAYAYPSPMLKEHKVRWLNNICALLN